MRGGVAGAFYELKVQEITRLAESAVAIGFDVPESLSSTFDFVQGQHVAVRAPGTTDCRFFSICTFAGSGRLRIGVRLGGGGRVSRVLGHSVGVGDVLDVSPPAGAFHTALHPANSRHYVAVAGGSGVTPILSIVSTALRTEPMSRATLLCCNRTRDSIMFADELRALEREYGDRLRVVHVLTRERAWSGTLTGRAAVREWCRDMLPSADDWLLCGPPEMVLEVRELLLSGGVSLDAVHTDVTVPTRRPVASPQ
ncbi:FAD-binding oxidoreductase [Luteipulveratus mongoliensis]|uniref:FAD-binding oxidoreductase n=1 Tax=Luteipulveratus mongoliensis TaxID=571913 RepID=UPI000695E72E|nr:FAD-binding oxidoreductase [Luteipulveratus mongoliensis]